MEQIPRQLIHLIKTLLMGKNKLTIMKLVMTLFVFILGVVLFVPSALAQSQYPIPALGSCNNAASCYSYCQMPEHTPACWSYGKYILHKNVLGDQTTALTFPIAELGNCASPQACREYCSQTANHETCSTYGQKKGLIRTQSQIKEKLLQAAKEKLGCTDEASCKAICSDPANHDKCEALAREVGLARAAQVSESSKPQELLNQAKQELGCDSQQSCMNFCSQTANQEKCREFGKKIMMEKGHGMGTEKGQWCNEHPDQCNGTPGMRPSYAPHPSEYGRPGMMPSSGSANWEMKKPCTEKECMNWCQLNPGKCPGYPPQNSGETMQGKMYRPRPTGYEQPLQHEQYNQSTQMQQPPSQPQQ